MRTDCDHLLVEFRSEVPLADAATVARIRRAATEMRRTELIRRRPPRPWRRPSVIIALAAALVLVGGSVAAVTEFPWWERGAPPVDPQSVDVIARDNLPADVDTSRARTVARAGDAALVAVPLNESGYCLIPSLDGRANFGGQCMYQVVNARRGDSDLTRSLAEPGTWIVYGRITDPRAAKIDLGALTVPLQTGGFFLAEVPEDKWPTLDRRANAGRILDERGATLRTGCVNWGPAPENAETRSGRGALWRNGGGACRPHAAPGPPTLKLDDAEKLVELTLASDFSIWTAGTPIALWQVGTDDGWTCTYVAAASPAPSGTSDGPPSGPAQCGRSDGDPAPASAAVKPFAGVSFSSGSGGIITGRVGARSGVAKIVLTSASGAAVLPFGGGWFIGQLPEGGAVGELPPGGPFTLIAYDSDGTELGRASLEEIKRAATPE